MAVHLAFIAIGLAKADNVLVRPWGNNTVRIQISPSSWTLTDDIPTAYLPASGFGSAGYGSAFQQTAGPTISGNIKVEQGSDGLLTVTKTSDGTVLLKEQPRAFRTGGAAQCPDHGTAAPCSAITFDFGASATKLYGMGQNRHANNGPGLGMMVINESYSFQDSIGEEGGPSNSLPYVMGGDPKMGFQFGLLFNSPSLGGVVYGSTTMSWSIIADDGNQKLRQQFDFLISTHAADAQPEEKPFQIIEKYVDAVGHARKMPWPGYWHSKNRYASQDELLTAARGFHNRSVPVDVIVIDWFHWKIMGDWSFNPDAWPDPKAMVDECRSYGMEIMVSVWPFTCPGSRSYDALVKNNWVTTVAAADGSRTDIGIETHGKNCRHVDATNPDFRKYAWSLIETGYYNYGIKIFWLDASEPEGFGPLSTNATWSAGSMRDMGSLFTLYWTQVFYDGLKSHGEGDIVMLPRAGWVGTWRHGAVLWSGDIGSTMPVLKSQMNIGISAQISGIPWWTTDVGGYRGGNSQSPEYRETIGRWFQYGMTNPLLRQHGARDHTCPWFYGNETEKIIEDIIRLRHAMKPYISAQLDLLNQTGRPFNRPLMWDFPADPKVWELAEAGIGDTPTPGPAPPAGQVNDGDWVVLAKCSPGWNQSWTFNGGNRYADEFDLNGGSMFSLVSETKHVLDSGGAKGHSGPTGPYRVHMWTADKKYSGAQTWSYDATHNALQTREGCLTAGDGTHPDIATCNPGDSDQQFTFVQGGTITSAAGTCLSVVPASSGGGGGGGGGGVIDQYMMGDDYMAAPILNLGQRSRNVYFPLGTDWTHHYTGAVYKGGTTEAIPAPLDSFPLFKRTDSSDDTDESSDRHSPREKQR